METKEMLVVVSEMLNSLKMEQKMGNGEIMVRYNNQTHLVNPCGKDGKAIVGLTMSLNIGNIGEFHQTWQAALNKYQCDPTYDDWYATNLNMDLVSDLNQPGPKRVLVSYKPTTFEDLKVILQQKESFIKILDMVRILKEYLSKADKEV